MNKTAIIAVDLLYDFTNPNGKVYYPENEAILENVETLLQSARAHGKLVVFLRHEYRKGKPDANLQGMRECCIEGTKGVEIDERLSVSDADYLVKKRRYSGFFGTDLDLILKEHGIENVIVVGTKTNNCVNATALDSHYRDYKTYVVAECVATNDAAAQEVYLRDIDRYIGKVLSLEETLKAFESGDL